MNLCLDSMDVMKIVLLIFEAMLLTDCVRGPPRVSDRVTHRQTARLGSAIKLPCPVEADPPPFIRWTKDGRIIHSGWIRFRMLRMGLKIKEVEADDAGTFNCQATNGFGSVNVNYTLIIIDDPRSDNSGPANGAEPEPGGDKLARPRFTQPEKMRRRVIACPVGSTVRLKCSASGNPRPDIVWLKDDRPLTEQEVGEGRQRKWTLSLKNVVPEHSGKYTCRVSNRAGEINATYKVEVIREKDELQTGTYGDAPGKHHGGLWGHHVPPVQSAQRREAGHPVAKARGVPRGEPLQLYNRSGGPQVCGAAHRGGVVPARRLLPQQAAHYPRQGGRRRHVHLLRRQHHGLQLPQRIPDGAARHEAARLPAPVQHQLPPLARHHRHPGWSSLHLRHGPAVVLPEQEALPASQRSAAAELPPHAVPRAGPGLPGAVLQLFQPRQRLPELRGLPGPAAASPQPGRTQRPAQNLPQNLHGHPHAHPLPRGREGASAPAHPFSVLA